MSLQSFRRAAGSVHVVSRGRYDQIGKTSPPLAHPRTMERCQATTSIGGFNNMRQWRNVLFCCARAAVLPSEGIHAVDCNGDPRRHASAGAWHRSNLERAADGLDSFIHADETEPLSPHGVHVKPLAIIADGEG